jgi:hypothetical protein
MASTALDLGDPASEARVRETSRRVLAGYMALQAAVGVLFWVALLSSPDVRSLFELMPSRHAVTDAFLLADLVVGVTGSIAAASGLWIGARWAVPALAFTTGGIVYPTLFLVCWVAMEGTGGACLAIMVPPSILGLYVTWRAWLLGPGRS